MSPFPVLPGPAAIGNLRDFTQASFRHLSAQALDRLLGGARALKRAAQAGAVQPLLNGKCFGLVCSDEAEPAAALFRQAVTELGGHVSRLRPSLIENSPPQELRNAAHMLGRLYGAVECQDMSRSVVSSIARHAGVPVYEGLAAADHPTAQWADMLDTDTANRRFLVQAVLLCSLA